MMNADVFKVVYLIQIAFLLACIYMTWRTRHALNGLGRGLILLFALLIGRRIDDAFGLLDSVGTLILSSAVVLVIAFDIWQIYKNRDMYELYLAHRQARIEELEKMRTSSEHGMPWDKQPVSRI